jgi:MFS family permease
MNSINSSIVSTALPRIGESLHSSINWTAWTLTIYQLGQVIAAPVAGRVSDMFGRKKVFLVCTSILTVCSFLSGTSTSIYMLLPFRFLQALGGGAILASTAGIVSDFFGSERDRAIGMFTSITPIGQIIGPVIGGILVQYWSWRGIFWINVPIGIVLVALSAHYIPGGKPSGSTAFDFKGVALLVPLILSVMLGITMLGQSKASLLSPAVFGPFAIAIITAVAFARHSKNAADPFIPLRLLRGQGFLTMNAVNLCYGMMALGFSAMVPLYAQYRYHMNPSHAGTVLAGRGIGTIIIAAAAAMMIRKTGYRKPMVVGFAAIAASLIMLSIAPQGLSPYWWLAIFSVLTGLGVGVAAPATNNATLQRAPDSVAAMVGIRQMFRQAGGITFISIATAFMARSNHPGLVQAHIFQVAAVIVVAIIALIFTVPDHKGSW